MSLHTVNVPALRIWELGKLRGVLCLRRRPDEGWVDHMKRTGIMVPDSPCGWLFNSSVAIFLVLGRLGGWESVFAGAATFQGPTLRGPTLPGPHPSWPHFCMNCVCPPRKMGGLGGGGKILAYVEQISARFFWVWASAGLVHVVLVKSRGGNLLWIFMGEFVALSDGDFVSMDTACRAQENEQYNLALSLLLILQGVSHSVLSGAHIAPLFCQTETKIFNDHFE